MLFAGIKMAIAAAAVNNAYLPPFLRAFLREILVTGFSVV